MEFSKRIKMRIINKDNETSFVSRCKMKKYENLENLYKKAKMIRQRSNVIMKIILEAQK